jgi:hypothetical protein
MLNEKVIKVSGWLMVGVLIAVAVGIVMMAVVLSRNQA